MAEEELLDGSANNSEPQPTSVEQVAKVLNPNTEERKVSRKYLTRFHSQMIKNLCGWEEGKLDLVESGLLVTAAGLGVVRVLMYLVELYSRSEGITILLNTDAQEVLFLKNWLADINSEAKSEEKANLDRIYIMNAETQRNERIKIYEKGGVISITSRILIVDMLDNSLPISKVTSIIVNRSDKIVNSSVEKFILRLYKDKNNTGIVRAISDEPRAFTGGINQLERSMKALQQTKVILWPRFRVEVCSELNEGKIELIEVRVPLNKLLKEMQEGLVECAELSIKELRRLNPSVDLENVVIEEALFPDFDSYVKTQLIPVWHRVCFKTKKIVSELSLLRQLLVYLLSFDCVSFYSTLKTIAVANSREAAEQSEEDPTVQPHSWLMLDAAQMVLMLSRKRVYNKNDREVNFKLEEQPKWKALRNIMTLIEKDRKNKKTDKKEFLGNVLIVVESSNTASQISQILTDSGNPPKFLTTLLNEHFSLNSISSFLPKSDEQREQLPENEYKKKRRRVRETENDCEKLIDYNFLIDDFAKKDVSEQLSSKLPFKELQNDNYSNFEKVPDMINDYILIWPLKNNTLDTDLSKMYGEEDSRILETFKPHYIVMYDPNLGFVRRIEIYRVLFPDFPIKVYSLIYEGSIEEQRYLFQIRKERSVFEKLIKDSAVVSIPINYQKEGWTQKHFDESFLWDAIDSRDLTGARSNTGIIVVDIREFRSSLPFALYEQNVRLLPCTLEVGDYVISPNIVIERKSISDLLQSLSSGRLYSQASAMSLHYDIPILLIEWGKDQPFCLRYDSHIKGEVPSKQTQNKLVLLCLAFPKLRILWSSSPEASAEMIMDLKKNQDEPDINTATSIGVVGPSTLSMTFSLTPVEILKSLPSVTSKNYRYLISKASSLRDLVQKSREWFEDVLGKSPGFLLWSFINRGFRSSNVM